MSNKLCVIVTDGRNSKGEKEEYTSEKDYGVYTYCQVRGGVYGVCDRNGPLDNSPFTPSEAHVPRHYLQSPQCGDSDEGELCMFVYLYEGVCVCVVLCRSW